MKGGPCGEPDSSVVETVVMVVRWRRPVMEAPPFLEALSG